MNQDFISDSASGCLVTVIEHSLVGSGGMPSPRTFCKIKAFLVRFPGFSADVSIGLNDNASFT